MDNVSDYEGNAERDEPVLPRDPVTKAVGRLNRVLHALAGIIMVLMMALVVADVVGRKFLNHPVPGSIELVELGLIAVIFFGFGNAQLHGEHITIDLLHSRLGHRGRAALTVFAQTISFAIVGVLTWRLMEYTTVLAKGDYATATWHIPLSGVGVVAVIGSAAFALAILVTLAASAIELKKELTK